MPAEISLRQRKHAKTKLAIVNTAIEMMRDKSLDDVNVKDICEKVSVSEVTFYNYFPKKTDLLTYYMDLWTMQINIMLQEGMAESHLDAIGSVFKFTASEINKNPNVMNEIIVYIVRSKKEKDCHDLPKAEMLEAFPDKPDIRDMHIRGVDDIFMTKLSDARKEGELPKGADIKSGSKALFSILLGVPISLNFDKSLNVEREYIKQLRMLWTGLKGGKK
ncbi:TetR/AcrR family transcriptional regulator [Candidatus Altiarchaeota archaeon]